MSDCVVDCDETGILPSGSIGGLNFIQQAAPFATTGCNCELFCSGWVDSSGVDPRVYGVQYVSIDDLAGGFIENISGGTEIHGKFGGTGGGKGQGCTATSPLDPNLCLCANTTPLMTGSGYDPPSSSPHYKPTGANKARLRCPCDANTQSGTYMVREGHGEGQWTGRSFSVCNMPTVTCGGIGKTTYFQGTPNNPTGGWPTWMKQVTSVSTPLGPIETSGACKECCAWSVAYPGGRQFPTTVNSCTNWTCGSFGAACGYSFTPWTTSCGTSPNFCHCYTGAHATTPTPCSVCVGGAVPQYCYCCWTGFYSDCLPFEWADCKYTGPLFDNDAPQQSISKGTAEIYFDLNKKNWALKTTWTGSNGQWPNGQIFDSDCDNCTGLEQCANTGTGDPNQPQGYFGQYSARVGVGTAYVCGHMDKGCGLTLPPGASPKFNCHNTHTTYHLTPYCLTPNNCWSTYTTVTVPAGCEWTSCSGRDPNPQYPN